MSRIRLIHALAVLVILAASFVSIECSFCLSMITKYYECKNPNVTLDDSFYASLKLHTMSLDQAIKLYSQMYKESLCSNSTCTCISKYFSQGSYGNFSLLFGSKSSLAAIKATIAGLNKDKNLLKHRYNVSYAVQKIYETSGVNYSSSVVSFCLKYEVSPVDLDDQFYDNFEYCVSSGDPLKAFGWSYTMYVDKNNYTGPLSGKLTQKQYESYLTYVTLNFLKCSPAHQRLYLISYWIASFKDLNVKGKNVLSYFDYLAKRAKKNPPIVFKFAKITKTNSNTFSITKINNNSAQVVSSLSTTNAQNFTETCFKSKSLIIECKFAWLNDSSKYVIYSFNMTFVLPKVKKLKNVYSYSFENYPYKTTNGYIKNPINNRKNLLYFQSVGFNNQIYEFNTNTFIYTSDTFFQFYVPAKFVNKVTSGLLVDGIFKTKF